MTVLQEHQAYDLFNKNGIMVPEYHFVQKGMRPSLPEGKTYVAKVVQEDLLHKSDVGGICLFVESFNADDIHDSFEKKFPDLEGVLYAEKIEYPAGLELLIGAHQDSFFGPLVTVGFGGTATEYYKEIMKPGKSSLIFPATCNEKVMKVLLIELPIIKMLTGDVRGFTKLVDIDEIVKTVKAFAHMLLHEKVGIKEVEANPLVPSEGKLVAIDAVCRLGADTVTTVAKKPIEKIASLLAPKSVAIVGASGKNSANPSNIILKKLKRNEALCDTIYPIHPKEEAVEGVSCVSDFSTLLKKRDGDPVDLLIVGVPAHIAGVVISNALETYAAHAIQIISAGFGETEKGKNLQRDLEKKLEALNDNLEKRPVINGPNTLGNIYYDTKTLFTPGYKSSGTGKGHANVGLICQSGAFMITAISDLANIINPSVALSVGNQMDLTVSDYLEFLLDDDQLTTFGLYIEGLKEGDGLHLIQLCEKASTMGKRIVVYKAGRTREGADAAQGHTAAMAGDYATFKDLIELHHGIVADSFDQFSDLLMTAALLPSFAGKAKFGVAALSNAGFEKCAIADHLMEKNEGACTIADFNEKTKKRLAKIFEDHNIAGIMDMHDILDLTPMMNDEGFESIITTTLEDPHVDFGIYSIVPETVMLNTCPASERHREDFLKEGAILYRLIAIHKKAKKPFIVSMESGEQYNPFALACIEAGIPCFRRVDEAARVVGKILHAAQKK
jgi:acyl-CoA synthetase (NDP forming)